MDQAFSVHTPLLRKYEGFKMPVLFFKFKFLIFYSRNLES